MSVEERVGQLIVMVGGPAKAARITGRAASTIDNWRAGTRIPLMDALALAREAKVSLDWVATGYDRRPDLPEPAALPGFRVLPIYRAGPGEKLVADADATVLAFAEDWLRSIGVNPADAVLIASPDDAMTPEIGAGDLLLVDRGVSKIRAGGIYAISRNAEVLIRRVQLMIDGGVQLIPSNTVYEKERLTPEIAGHTAIVGQVRWCGRLL